MMADSEECGDLFKFYFCVALLGVPTFYWDVSFNNAILGCYCVITEKGSNKGPILSNVALCCVLSGSSQVNVGHSWIQVKPLLLN